MSWRDFAVNNSRLKLTAFMLALLAWFAIKFAIYKGIAGRNQVVRHQPVMVLKSPDDGRALRVEPPFVDIVVQANKELGDNEDIEVFVDITKMPADVDSVFKPVLVRGSEIMKVVAVQPAWVARVERIGYPETSATNGFRNNERIEKDLRH